MIIAHHNRTVGPFDSLSLHRSSPKQAQCKSVLDKISHQINNQHPELAGHRLLSIFKMAEMQVIIPETSGGGSAITNTREFSYRVSLAFGCAVLAFSISRGMFSIFYSPART